MPCSIVAMQYPTMFCNICVSDRHLYTYIYIYGFLLTYIREDRWINPSPTPGLTWIKERRRTPFNGTPKAFLLARPLPISSMHSLTISGLLTSPLWNLLVRLGKSVSLNPTPSSNGKLSISLGYSRKLWGRKLGNALQSNKYIEQLDIFRTANGENRITLYNLMSIRNVT